MFANLSKEEQANTWTHLVAFMGTLLIVYPLVHSAIDSKEPVWNTIGVVLFLVGAMLMYGSSTLYHAIVNPANKRRLRDLDHIGIYVMIAGSYSLICLSVIGGGMGWTLFIFLWVCVLAGTIGKVIALGKYPRISLMLYLAMGWVALLILWPMWLHMPHAAFWWIVIEGVFYTIGAYFFSKDEEHVFYHAIWHLFIMLGSMSHTIATWLILKA